MCCPAGQRIARIIRGAIGDSDVIDGGDAFSDMVRDRPKSGVNASYGKPPTIDEAYAHS
jgi:hypothetical protein